MKNQSKQQTAITEAMKHIQAAQDILRNVEWTDKQIKSYILGTQYWNVSNQLDKSFGMVSRLWDMSSENPLVKV